MPWGDGGLSGVHAGASGGFGSGGLAGPSSQAQAAPKKKGRGILGTIGHDISSTAHGFEQKAVGIGPGLYEVGKAVVHDASHHPTGGFGGSHLFQIGKATAHQTVRDFTHPHGDFSGAILDALTVASAGAGAGARVAAVGRAAKAGESVGDIGKAAVLRPKPEPRSIAVPHTNAKIDAGTYSRAASTRTVQKGLDVLREKYPNIHFGLRNQHQRIGRERAHNAAYEERIANFNNKSLLAKASGLKKAQQFAIQVVNEKVPLATRIEDAKTFRAEATNPRVQSMLDRHIKVLTQVQKYVHDVEGTPRLRPGQAHLADVYEHAASVANKRTEDLVAGGLLKADTAENALSRVSRHFAPQEAVSPPLFHGTPHAFEDFNPSHVGAHTVGGEGAYGPGYYFTENPKVASTYAQHELLTKVFPDSEQSNAFIDQLRKQGGRAHETIRRPDGTYEVHFQSAESRPNVKIAHLRLTRPFDVDVAANATYYHDLAKKLGSKTAANKELQRQGYDGIKHTGGDIVGDGSVRHQVWVAFKPEQVSHGFPDHRFNGDAVPELKQSDFFISYRNAKNPKKLGEVPMVGNGSSVGIPNRLSETSHQFTGAGIRTGNINPKAVEQVAVDSQRANKVLAVWRQRNELGRISSDTKLTENHIPIRPIWLKNKRWPAEVKDAIDGLQQNLSPDQELKLEQRLHDYIFPEKDVSVGAAAKGVKWIDKRYLGGLSTPKTLGAAEKIGRVADKVNTPFRAATLFKPGYIPANLANNIFLNVIQGSTHHLVAASKISRSLGVEDAAKLDAVMGEGKTASVGRAAGLGRNLNEASNKIQRGLGKIVDVVPRRAAFLHEAHRFGYKTTADIQRLLNDPALHPDLIRVSREANSELIDYANLGPAEQSFVRRVIFLYPWVKGATMKGGRFLKEQPIKAGVLGQVGHQGNDAVKRIFGDIPSYAQGLVKVGNYVVNTEPLNNFPQAAQELGVVVGLMQKHPLQSAQIIAQASPAVQALFSPSTGSTALDSLSGASLIRLGQEFFSPSHSEKKVYPQSSKDAMLRFLIGSAAPRKINLNAAHSAAARESTGH